MTTNTNVKKPHKPKKKGSGIEWTGLTWNPVVGCTPVSPGCLNCYAATMARRLEAMGKPEYQPREVKMTAEEVRQTRAAMHAATGTYKLYEHEQFKEVRIAEVRGGRAVFTGDVRTVPDRLGVPLKRRTPTVWFVNSMADLFHEAVPFEFIDRVFAVMALCPQHTFQVLTKRPERMAEYLRLAAPVEFGETPPEGHRDIGHFMTECHQQREDDPSVKRPITAKGGWPDNGWEHCSALHEWPLPNVWLGTSVEDQERADERIPHLLRCPAAVRFLSCEPLLGEVDLGFPQGCRGCNHPGNIMPSWNERGRCSRCDGTRQEPSKIHWVITGGESGPDNVRREVPVQCITGVADQCLAAGVPVFIKQDSGRKPGQQGRIPDEYWALQQMPEVLK